MEAASRYGLAAARKAELPAKPAAIKNGKIGKQQLDAASTLPIAARLANVAFAPVCRLGLILPCAFRIYPGIHSRVKREAVDPSYLVDTTLR